mgnify:CR=1 FL=1
MSKNDEKVLVVPSNIIFKQGRWQGLKKDNLDYYLDLIKNNYQFKRRGDVETDPSWQQIIPYIVFSHNDKFFIYKYLGGAGEKRLIDNYIIGIGGHINQIDENGSDILEIGAMREWQEEVNYKGNLLEKKLVGIVNDDSRPVESVHLGLVYHFVGNSPEISIKEKDKMQGELVNLKDINGYISGNQGVWIKLVYKDYLSKLA